MKNFQLISILIVALLFPISGHADKEKDVYVTNPSLDVNVNNTPMVEIVNTDPIPTIVNNTSSNPIPVTMNESNRLEIKSAYAVVSGNPITIMAVPSGKTFILTDIISATGGVFDIFENENLKTQVSLLAGSSGRTSALSIHFRTGISFSSSSNIVIDNNNNNKNITIAGYLLDN